MKKLFISILMLFTVVVMSSTAMGALLKFDNWGFSPTLDGTGIIQGIDEFTYRSISLVNSTVPAGNNGTFVQWSAAKATDILDTNGASLAPGSLNVGYEITLVLRDAAGSFVADADFVNTITYNTAYLDIYLDNTINYGTASVGSTIYGATDGILIGSFKLVSGSGTMDFGVPVIQGGPDGRINLGLVADAPSQLAGLVNGLRPNTWYDDLGVDISTYDPLSIPVIAFIDSNNQYLTPNATQIAEFTKSGLSPVVDDTGFQNFFAKSDGSYDLGVNPVPEPGTLVLMGFGLLSLAGAARKRMKRN